MGGIHILSSVAARTGRYVLFSLLAVLVRSVPAATVDGDGNYPLSYVDANGRTAVYVLVPSNKVVPSIRTTIDDAFEYTYRVGNGPDARQGISSVSFVIRSPDGIIPDRTHPSFGHAPSGFALSCNEETGGLALEFSSIYSGNGATAPATIRPGFMSSFTIVVPHLAGIVEAKVRGYVPPERCAVEECAAVVDGEGREIEYPELDAQLTELYDLSIPVLIAAPVLKGSTVDEVRAELSRWPDLGQSSRSFVAQAIPRLDVLASAVSHGNRASAVAALDEFLAFMRTTDERDLSALGAQVLHFDLRQIARRMPP